MKKLLVVFAIGAFAACNNPAETASDAVDSVKAAGEQQIEAVKDSAAATIDSVAAKADSTISAVADSLKK